MLRSGDARTLTRMSSRSLRAPLVLVLAVASSAGLLSYACSSEEPAGAPGVDGGVGAPDRFVTPEPEAGADAGGDAAGPSDAGLDARAKKDANGPGAEDAGCSFNRDCNIALRCECEQGDCRCARGARGAGQVGVDRCDGGNDCESSVCVEGPAGAYYCTDECVTPADCAGALPKCADIAFVGRICIRDGG